MIQPNVHTWADGFGIWHARVSRNAASPIIAARRALRDELQARESSSTPVAPWVWKNPVHVPDYDDAETIVYREGDRGGPATIPYAASMLVDMLEDGPYKGEDFYRVKVTGNGETKWFNVSPAQITAFAEIMNADDAPTPDITLITSALSSMMADNITDARDQLCRYLNQSGVMVDQWWIDR